MKKYGRLLSAAVASALIPSSVWACSACALADPKNSKTYLDMTLFMSALPLLMVGGLAYWLWRRYS
jgi:hypothetical protein